jgi:predicted nucleotidyltransferase
MARSAAEVEEIIRRVIDLAAERVPLRAVYLFGSYCDGTADDDSDIDIALFSEAAGSMPLTEKVRLLSDIRLVIDREVELHLFDAECLEEARPSNIYGHILATGRKVG